MDASARRYAYEACQDASNATREEGIETMTARKRVNLKPVVERGPATMYCGDMREVVPQLGQFTACVCDPPYELEFMGKSWDKSGIAFDPSAWKVVFDAVKPGGMLLAFGGSRTFHRIAVAIEDAGWVIRDTIIWMYGQGFPKSLDISKAIDRKLGVKRLRNVVPEKRSKLHGDRPWMNDPNHRFESKDPVTTAAADWNGYGTALKPAFEPIIVAMKPLDGTFAGNALEHGVAGMAIDGARVGTKKMEHFESTGEYTGKRSQSMACAYTKGELKGVKTGRWPANVILDDEAARQLDRQSGVTKGGRRVIQKRIRNKGWVNSSPGPGVEAVDSYGDSGDASRFFYTAKVSRAERQAGLEALEKNMHPTVKPVDLMRYLIKLVTMPSCTRILDPFAGEGATLVACKQLGIECVGVDLEEEHCRYADGRLSYRGAIKRRKRKTLKRRKGK